MQMDTADDEIAQRCVHNGWIQDDDLNDYLRAMGSNLTDLTNALREGGIYNQSINRRTGEKIRHYRRQVSICFNKKPHINYVKCFVTIRLVENQPNFCLRNFTSRVFQIDPDDETLVERGWKVIQQVYAEVAPTLSRKLEKRQAEVFEREAAMDEDIQEAISSYQEEAKAIEESSKLSSTPSSKTSAEKRRRSGRSIFKAFMEDLFLGLGIDEMRIREYHEKENQGYNLEAYIKEIAKDIEHRRSTFKQYVTIQNLFLLFTNMTNPDMFKEHGVIFINETLCHYFLQECLAGNICLTGQEPPIADVLIGLQIFEPSKASERFKEGNGNKFLNALSDLYSKQRMLLGLPNVPRLREYGLIKMWLSNLCNSEADQRETNFENRHGSIFPFDDPFGTARAQNDYLMANDSWHSVRLRCLLLTQLWSISRWNEMVEWKLCDLMVSSFTPEGDSSLKQPIIPIFFLQTKFKGSKRKRKTKPQKRLLVRRKDPSLCPQSALAMFLFERFVMDGEENVDLLSDKKNWYCIKIFRERLNRLKVPCSSSFRAERQKVNDQTETSISGIVNHYGRQLGSYIGKACGLSDSEVKEVGLWKTDTHTQHYFSTYNASTIAKLSGYNCKESFCMPRALASTLSFSNKHPEFKAFFDDFMKFTTCEETRNHALEIRKTGDHTPFMVLKALVQLKEVFFQDLVYYKSHWPNLRLWNSLYFRKHAEAFSSWSQFVQSFEEPSVQQPSNSLLKEELKELRLIKEELRAINVTLKKLIGESKIPLTEQPLEDDETSKHSPTGKTEISQLRILNDMDVQDVVQEWFESVSFQGVEFKGGLRQLKQDRTITFHPSLRTQLRRRRNISEKALQLSKILGSIDKAICVLEHVRLRNGEKMPLWKLAEKISASNHKRL